MFFLPFCCYLDFLISVIAPLMRSKESASLAAPPHCVIKCNPFKSDMSPEGVGGRRPRFPCPQVPLVLWDSQGLRKTQFTIFPQWWPPNDSLPLSPLYSWTFLFFLSGPCFLAGQRFGKLPSGSRFALRGKQKGKKKKKKRSRPTLHKPHRPGQLSSFVPLPRPPPPTPDLNIFTAAENPSHEQWQSTEVI